MIKMKDSGVEWIGEIPNDWEIAQVRYLFKIGRGRVIAQTEVKENGQYPVYSSQTKNNGCLGYIDTYDFDLSQLTWTTDGANAGTVFLRKGKHNCTNVCGTLQPLTSDLNLRFQKYALEHIAFYHKRADTNGFKIMNNEMAAIHTICPPIDIQQRIADYLDEKCIKIDKIIEKQQAVIEKLKEYKLSLITETVTKGFTSDVKMKNSGINWIGSIPEDWIVCRIKNIYRQIKNAIKVGPFGSQLTTQDYVLDGKWVYTQRTVLDNNFSSNDTFISDEKYASLKGFSVEAGDVLITTRGTGTTGHIALVPEEYHEGILHPCLMRIKLDTSKCAFDFLRYVFEYGTYIREQIEYASNTSSLPVLYSSTLGNLYLALPDIDKQKEIVNYLNVKCIPIDKSINQALQIIDKLNEYKKSLIYEVVTGKKEV